ncbi:MAG: hypothetical protein CVU31_07815 [Betaproteobacteria bacterium HGW-Betaproteobacteria-4]|jgi:flagellar hook-length control protein FliK|nr:MAG: hypothetical protein CVU31_07815 [Betaproteobacteria bacterium HGW-Betaproteobacteria-4]
MSISAVSTLIAASGGKAALPGLGELLTDSGLPLDFAALLAEQLPTAGQAEPSLLPGEATPARLKPGYDLQAQLAKQASPTPDSGTLPVIEKQIAPRQGTEERAEDILAALSSPSQPAETFGLSANTTITEGNGKKEGDEKDPKALPLPDPTQTDPGLAAQYIAPQIATPVQNRLPDQVDREKPSISERTSKADNAKTTAEDDRPALPQRANTELPSAAPALPPAAQAAKAGEPRIIPRSDNANAAILAGDTNPGNSGNTPAFATALAATSAAGAAAPSTAPAPSPAVHTALGSPNWSQDFGSRIVWLAKNDQQVAQININPPRLGPVQISISLSGDVVTTTFASPHAEVRQAIQDSLPQLRDMFSTAGISLGEANVGSQLPSQNREAAFQFANEARTSRETAILSPDSHASSAPSGIPVQRGRGLVDLFA